MGANQQSWQHLSSAVLQPAEIISLGGEWGLCQVCREVVPEQWKQKRSAKWLDWFEAVLEALEARLEMMAHVLWFAEGENLRSTISSLREIVSLPRWPITQISLGCTRAWLCTWCHVEWSLVVELGSAWKWWLQRRVTIPWWWWWCWMKLIRWLPELIVIARCISTIIIWCSHIVIWALLWAKQPTWWNHLVCLRRKSIRRHRMWTTDGSNQRMNSIGDFEWSGAWLRILKVAVTFDGI